MFIAEDGNIKLIDNDAAFTSIWGLNSVFIPGTPVGGFGAALCVQLIAGRMAI